MLCFITAQVDVCWLRLLVRVTTRTVWNGSSLTVTPQIILIIHNNGLSPLKVNPLLPLHVTTRSGKKDHRKPPGIASTRTNSELKLWGILNFVSISWYFEHSTTMRQAWFLLNKLNEDLCRFCLSKIYSDLSPAGLLLLAEDSAIFSSVLMWFWLQFCQVSLVNEKDNKVISPGLPEGKLKHAHTLLNPSASSLLLWDENTRLHSLISTPEVSTPMPFINIYAVP